MRKSLRSVFVIGLTAIGTVIGTSGCAQLVPGPPGDAGITYSSNGAEGDVKAAPDRVASVSANVLSEMGIRSTSTTQTEVGHVVTGKHRVDQVRIVIQKEDDGSHVEVLDSTGNSNWNQDFSAIILLQIKNSV